MTPDSGGENGLSRRLTAAGLIHLDARVLALYLLGKGPVAGTDAVLAAIREGRIKAQTSSLSLYQILVEVYRQGETALAAEIARTLRLYTRLAMVPAGPEIAVQAAEVRARLGGRAERAFQIATALVSGAEIYLTSGSALRRIAGMQILNVEDFTAGDEPVSGRQPLRTSRTSDFSGS